MPPPAPVPRSPARRAVSPSAKVTTRSLGANSFSCEGAIVSHHCDSTRHRSSSVHTSSIVTSDSASASALASLPSS
eukprot:7021734-Pyramimonas_sp.AAC.1